MNFILSYQPSALASGIMSECKGNKTAFQAVFVIGAVATIDALGFFCYLIRIRS